MISLPAGAAIDDGPGNKCDLVLEEYVSKCGPVVRVGDAILDIVKDSEDTINAVGVIHVLDELLQIFDVVLLSLEVDPVVELHRGVRRGICVDAGHEDVI